MSYFKQPFTLSLSNAVPSKYTLHSPVYEGVQSTQMHIFLTKQAQFGCPDERITSKTNQNVQF